MASRRTRIKGIVNIPQRRKPGSDVSTLNQDVKEGIRREDSNLELVSQATQACVSPTVVHEDPSPCVSPEEKSEVANHEVKVASIENQSSIKPTQPSFRRRILKPAISLKAINKTNTPPSVPPTNEEPHTPKAQDAPVPESASISSCHVPVTNDTLKSEGKIAERLKVLRIHSPLKQPQINNDCINKEISLLGITNLPPLLQNSDNNLETTHEQDVNRPPPTCSPSKVMNRARIKAVPRLGQRRPSFSIGSASESEDESKKTFKTLRVRNDSACSTVSTPTTYESPAVIQDANSSRKKTEFNTVIQRKCKRTEQSRKLAEARREFQLKFSDGKPDRQKLTMIDLIFYNPSSSPMSQKRKRQDTETSNISREQHEAEEEVDEPLPMDESQEPERSDEENTMPAPQITIGANGEIVIDEKSLFIENKELQRDRDALKKSTIVDGDQCNNMYGVFKRVKRSKDWSKPDTLRFYKALNTIGTDFTLMCELFPGRSRRELKLKFKKEERINRALIDRAVMQPIQFDISDLQKDLELEELEQLRKEQLKRDIEQTREARKARIVRQNQVEKEDHNTEEQEPKPKNMRRRVSIRREVPKTLEPSTKEILKNKLKQGINSLLDSDGDSDGEQRTTEKSDGRKVHENNNRMDTVELHHIGDIQQDTILTPPETLISSETSHIEVDVTSTLTNVEEISIQQEYHKPLQTIAAVEERTNTETREDEHLAQGSIILSTVVDEHGQDVYKVFTVNEKGEKIPVDLTPDIMEVLLKSHKPEIEYEPDSDNFNQDESVILPSDATMDNIMADISLSNIHDQSNLSMTTDCMILSFEDIDMPLSSVQMGGANVLQTTGP